MTDRRKRCVTLIFVGVCLLTGGLWIFLSHERIQQNRIETLEQEVALIKAESNRKIKQWSDDTYNYLAIGNSITIHGENEYWWNECGMAATQTQNDYVHLLSTSLEKDKGKIDTYVFSFYAWEVQTNDRSEALPLLDGVLGDEIDLITIQLGENVSDLSTFETDFVELLNYIKEKAPKAKILVIGDFWTLDNRDKIKEDTAKAEGIEYVSLSDIKDNSDYFAGIGTKVYGKDGSEHIIEHDGVARHPGDKAMAFIADKIYQTLN